MAGFSARLTVNRPRILLSTSALTITRPINIRRSRPGWHGTPASPCTSPRHHRPGLIGSRVSSGMLRTRSAKVAFLPSANWPTPSRPSWPIVTPTQNARPGPPKAKTFSAKSTPPAWPFKNVRLLEKLSTRFFARTGRFRKEGRRLLEIQDLLGIDSLSYRSCKFVLFDPIWGNRA